MERAWKDNNMLTPKKTEEEVQNLLGKHLKDIGDYLYDIVPDEVKEFMTSPDFYDSGLAFYLPIFKIREVKRHDYGKWDGTVCVNISPEKTGLGQNKACRLYLDLEQAIGDHLYFIKKDGSFNSDLTEVGYTVLENWPEIKKNASEAIDALCDKVEQFLTRGSSRNSLLDSFTL